MLLNERKVKMQLLKVCRERETYNSKLKQKSAMHLCVCMCARAHGAICNVYELHVVKHTK